MTEFAWQNSFAAHVGNETVIYIWSRDIETKQVKRFVVKGFKHYFYVEDPKGDLLNCYGNPIRKVVLDSPDKMYPARKSFEDNGYETFEADIQYDMRYLIDKKIVYGHNEKMQPIELAAPIKPRTVFYDIEVDIPEGEPIDETLNKHPIVAISVLDSFTNEAKVFTLGNEKVHDKQVPCGDERGVINSFINYVGDNDPDVLTGWNNIGFDMPYILGRSAVHKVPTNRLSRMGYAIKDPARLAGRTHIDMLEFFRDWSKPLGQMPTYGLKYVAKTFAGFEYEDFGEKVQTLVKENKWNTLVQYSVNDVYALQKIDAKSNLIGYHENLRRICGIKYDSTIKRTHIVETLLLRHGIKPIPTRKKKVSSGFEGALVIQPSAGIHEDVIFLDAKSLYPSIIIAFDLSPDIDKMIPKTITYILNEREKYRSLKMAGKSTEADETTEQSLKYIANSFYGVMGSPYFKLYDPEIAAFITRSGREINKNIQQCVLDRGYKILYGDTDSVAITPVKTIEEGKELEALVNKELLEWARKHNVKDEFAPIVKFEKFFRKMFFKRKSGGGEEAAKKKYVGHLIWKDGKPKDQIDYTGIEIRRSDTAPITKKLMESFFIHVLKNNDPDSAIKEIKAVLKQVKAGKVSVHDVAMPKGLKMFIGEGAWQRGVRHGIVLLNIKFDASKKPKLLYCKSPYDSLCIDDNVTDEEVRRVVSVDWETMADKVIAQKMRSLVESIGYEWDVITVGQKKLF